MRTSHLRSLILAALAVLFVCGAVVAGAGCLDSANPSVEQPAEVAAEIVFGADAETILETNLGLEDERCVTRAACSSDSDCGTGIWQGRCMAGGWCLCW